MTESDESTGPEKAACMAPTHVRDGDGGANDGTTRDTKAGGVLCWISGGELANLEPERWHFWRKEKKKNRHREHWWTSVTAQQFESSTGARCYVHYTTESVNILGLEVFLAPPTAWAARNQPRTPKNWGTQYVLSRAKISLPSFANPCVIHATPVPEINTLLLQRASFPHLPNHYRLAYFCSPMRSPHCWHCSCGQNGGHWGGRRNWPLSLLTRDTERGKAESIALLWFRIAANNSNFGLRIKLKRCAKSPRCHVS